MPRETRVSRRTVLQRSSICAGAIAAQMVSTAWSSPLGANDRIRVGVIGTGVRGKYLIGNLPESASVDAICDCASSRMDETLHPRNQFAEVLAGFRKQAARHCSTYQDYRRMIDRAKLDAVIIATPDHHHAQAAMLALDAGLDVYLEKPLTVTVREGRLLVEKVNQTGRILQVGSQQRTMEMNRFACEFIRDGRLGNVSRVDFPNYPGPLAIPAFPEEPIPDGLQWDLFLGPAPARVHNRKLWVKDEFEVGNLMWRGWDLFRDYSGHLMTNWGAHSIDMVQYALGMDHSGPVSITLAPEISEAALEQDWNAKWYLQTPRPRGSWKAATRFHPVTLEYANGTRLNLLPQIDAATFYGERGCMVISRNQFKTDPPDLIREMPDPSVTEKWKGAGYVARPHLQNWIDCMRTRDTPHAPVEVGHRTATICHLVNITRELQRPLRWDPMSERFSSDAMANRLLARPRREGFGLQTA